MRFKALDAQLGGHVRPGDCACVGSCAGPSPCTHLRGVGRWILPLMVWPRYRGENRGLPSTGPSRSAVGSKGAVHLRGEGRC